MNERHRPQPATADSATLVSVPSPDGSATPALPTVDVVVPCYNYAHFLPRCVRSILDQRGVSVRILIIDDQSSDDTPAVMATLMAADHRVHGRRHAVNLGHIATYNEGLLGWAEADYTVLISADDLLAPGALSRAAAVFAADPAIGMVYGRGVYFSDHDDLPRTVTLPLGVSHWSGRDWIEGRCRAGINPISSPEVVVRTSVQHAVGGYRPEYPHAGDLEMWLRIAAVSDIAYVRGRSAAYYRTHAASMYRSQEQSALSDLPARLEVFERFCADHADTVPGASDLRDAAGRALARDALGKVCRLYDHDRVDQADVEAVVEFASAAYPGFESLPEFRALRRRQRLGARFCHRTQLFIVPAVLRRARSLIWWQTWKWRGV